MTKIVVEFENKGNIYMVTRNVAGDYELYVDNIVQAQKYRADELLLKFGWLFHDSSVVLPPLKESGKN